MLLPWLAMTLRAFVGGNAVYDCAWQTPPGAGTYIAVVNEVSSERRDAAASVKFVAVR
jgi:hypothetical protein